MNFNWFSSCLAIISPDSIAIPYSIFFADFWLYSSSIFCIFFAKFKAFFSFLKVFVFIGAKIKSKLSWFSYTAVFNDSALEIICSIIGRSSFVFSFKSLILTETIVASCFVPWIERETLAGEFVFISDSGFVGTGFISFFGISFFHSR